MLTGVGISQSWSPPFSGLGSRGDLAVPRSRSTRHGQRCFAVSLPGCQSYAALFTSGYFVEDAGSLNIIAFSFDDMLCPSFFLQLCIYLRCQIVFNMRLSTATSYCDSHKMASNNDWEAVSSSSRAAAAAYRTHYSRRGKRTPSTGDGANDCRMRTADKWSAIFRH